MTAALLRRNRGSRARTPETPTRLTPRRCVLAGAGALLVGLFLGAGIAKLSRHDDAAAPAAPALTTSNTVPSAGPSSFDGMVPVGYLRNEAGAVAAAAAYTAMTTEMIFRPEAEARAAARRIAIPESASAVEAVTMKPIGGIRQTLALAGKQNPTGRAMVRTAPIGSRVVSYDTDRARVDVWVHSYFAVELGTALANTADAKPRGTFLTTSYELVWRDGDWKVSTMQTIEDTGPAFTRAQPVPATQFLDQVSGLTPFRYRANGGNQ